MLALAIETSCDETAAALVRDDGSVLAEVVQTQLQTHAPFAGVVPEYAARDHLRNILPVLDECLRRAQLSLDDIDGVAATVRPGLISALLVGTQVAKSIAWAKQKPFVGVDHLMGHLLAVFLQREGESAPRPLAEGFPFIGLLVSGGHTALYEVRGARPEDISELGATRDDAAGEAFDKVAKLLGLGYPGGPLVDRLAAKGNPRAIPFAAALPQGLEMSFSGLKSAVARHVERHEGPLSDAEILDLCASFQRTLVETLTSKTLRACEQTGIHRVVLGGGVAANRGLRERLLEESLRRRVELWLPPMASCTDNAAMIALVGALRLARGERDPLSLSPVPRTLLQRSTRKGGGRRAPRSLT